MNGPDEKYDGLTAFAPITTIATDKKKGLLSAADKAKLDSLSAGGGGVWAQIGSSTPLAAPAASWVFASIPATYRALMVLFAASQAGANFEENLFYRVNGDTAGNYDYGVMFFDYIGTAPSTAHGAAATGAQLTNIPGTSSPAGSATSGSLILPEYANTSHRKGWFGQAQQQRDDTSIDGRLWSYGGRWRSTAAITSLTFYSATSNLAVGSWFALYGLT